VEYYFDSCSHNIYIYIYIYEGQWLEDWINYLQLPAMSFGFVMDIGMFKNSAQVTTDKKLLQISD